MRFFSTALALFVLAAPAHAASGKEIIQKVLDQPAPNQARLTVKMTLKGKHEGVRQLTSYVKRKGSKTSSVIKFQEPADYRGAGILVIEKEDGEMDRYIRFNGQRRVRRLPPGSQTGSFLNTDFSYEDLDGRKDIDKDKHALLREEQLEGASVYVVETTPAPDSGSAYKRIVQWIRKDTYVPVKLEFYGSDEKPVKRLVVDELEQIDGYWVSTRSTMSTLAAGTATQLDVMKTDFKSPIADNVFKKQFLLE